MGFPHAFALICLLPALQAAELTPVQREDLAWVGQLQLVCEDGWVVRADSARLERVALRQDAPGRLARVVAAALDRRQLGAPLAALERLGPALVPQAPQAVQA